ncbi:hypothetical protein NN561_011908 [Cricetulus griseus]
MGTGILAPRRGPGDVGFCLWHWVTGERSLQARATPRGPRAARKEPCAPGARRGERAREDLAEGSRTGVVAGGGGGEALCDCTTRTEVISAYVASAGLAAPGHRPLCGTRAAAPIPRWCHLPGLQSSALREPCRRRRGETLVLQEQTGG